MVPTGNKAKRPDILYWKNAFRNERLIIEEALKSLKQYKAADFDDLNSNIIIDTYNSLKNILFFFFQIFNSIANSPWLS